MKILVTGSKGQLGTDLIRELEKRGAQAIGVDIDQMDITDSKACEDVIGECNKGEKLDAIIHCAAYTAVDKAEDDIELAEKVNAKGTENIARVCARLGIKLMYISTEYVFDGSGERPWKTSDARNPLNHYGKTKYEGELSVESLCDKYFIVRTSWVFGKNGNNFIKTMLKLGRERDKLNVVDDQIGSPTYTADLSVLLADMIYSDKFGKYHASNEGFCSWYEFACEIFKQANVNVEVSPVSSSEFPVKAERPKNSRMDKSELDEMNFKRLPSWQDALLRYLKEIGEV